MKDEITRRAFLAAGSAAVMCAGDLNAQAAMRGDLLLPRRAHEIESSPWGIWTAYGSEHISLRASEQHSNYSVDPAVFDLIDELGVKHAYVGWDWPAVEKRVGQYDFTVCDQIIDGLRRRGIAPFVQIYGSPNEAYGMDPSISQGVLLEERYLRAWLDAIGRTVERWRGKVDCYEIWNEPNAAPWFWTGNADPQSYAKMVKAVSQAIRSADSRAEILAGSVAMVPLDFVESFLASDSGTDWTGFSFHPYSEYPEGESLAIRELKGLLDGSRGHQVPIFQTECGYPSSSQTAGFRGPGPWSEAIQARWLLRRMLTDYAEGARLSTYFLLHDIPGEIEVGAGVGTAGVNEKGLVTMDGRRKPAFRALQNLCSLVDDRFSRLSIDATISAEVRAQSTGPGATELRSLALGTNGELTHYLLWDASPLRVDYRESVVTLTLLLPMPARYVLVDLLSGAISPLKLTAVAGHHTAIEVPLRDYPVAIVDSNVLSSNAASTRMKDQ